MVICYLDSNDANCNDYIYDYVPMLNYFLYSATMMNRNSIAFYGITESKNELKIIKADQILFSQQVNIIDCIGLNNHSFSMCNIKQFVHNFKIGNHFIILIFLY